MRPLQTEAIENHHPLAQRLYTALLHVQGAQGANSRGAWLRDVMDAAREEDVWDCEYRMAQLVSTGLVTIDGDLYRPETLFSVVRA